MVCARRPSEEEVTDEFLHDPALWSGRYLPIVNRKKRQPTGESRLAVVGSTVVPGALLVWYDANLYADWWKRATPKETTADELIADGWVVD